MPDGYILTSSDTRPQRPKGLSCSDDTSRVAHTVDADATRHTTDGTGSHPTEADGRAISESQVWDAFVADLCVRCVVLIKLSNDRIAASETYTGGQRKTQDMRPPC